MFQKNERNLSSYILEYRLFMAIESTKTSSEEIRKYTKNSYVCVCVERKSCHPFDVIVAPTVNRSLDSTYNQLHAH